MFPRRNGPPTGEMSQSHSDETERLISWCDILSPLFAHLAIVIRLEDCHDCRHLLIANWAVGVADITSLFGFEFGTSPTQLLQGIIPVVTIVIIFDWTKTLFSDHE